MVPVLLHSNIHPRVAAATSAYNYFFIGLTNVVKLLFDGFITKIEIAWFFGLAVFNYLYLVNIWNNMLSLFIEIDRKT